MREFYLDTRQVLVVGSVALIVIISTLLLMGCAAKPLNERYHKTGATMAQINQDNKECDYEAEKSVNSSGGGFAQGVEDGLKKVKLREMCMELRGYRQ